MTRFDPSRLPFWAIDVLTVGSIIATCYGLYWLGVWLSA